MRHNCRTQGQNEILVTHVLEELSKGFCLKDVASKYDLNYATLTNMLKRYRQRHGFKNIYHMLSLYIIVRERKGAKKLAPFKHLPKTNLVV
jgi:hypothetical protein